MIPSQPLFNPFPGLRPFTTEERHLFFGREAQAAELLKRLQRFRFLAAVGPSGSGKSSLVRAGLLPELYGGTLREAGSHWTVAVMRPGGAPLQQLGAALLETELFEPADADTPEIIKTALDRSSLGLAEVVRKSRLAAGENLLVVVDQFEEVFRFRRPAGDTADSGKAFVDLLLQASRQAEVPIYIVITMRSDFLGDCARYRGLAEAVNESEYLVPRLTREQWKLAIEGPVRVGGGQIAARLTQRLLKDVADDPDQLPTLQHALMRTWDQWVAGGNTGRPLDLEDYEAVGGLAQALSRHADEIYNELPDDGHRRVAERIFRALTDLAADNRGVRRPTRLADLVSTTAAPEEQVRRVVEAFRREGRALLTPPGELEADTVLDLSHESLMRIWRRLRLWAEAEAQSARLFLRLADAAALWKEGQAGLYRDPELEIALQWRAANEPSAAWAEHLGAGLETVVEFLEASRNARAAEREARAAARRRELEQAQQLAQAERRRAELEAQSASRMRRLAWAMGVLAGLAITLGLLAFFLGRFAHEQELLARTRELLARTRELALGAEQQLKTDPELSVLLASAAYRNLPTNISEQRVQNALRESYNRAALVATQTLQSALLASSVRAALRPGEKESTPASAGSPPTFEQVVFSPDGRVVAAHDLTVPSTNQGRLWLWRPFAGAAAYTDVLCGFGDVKALAFTPDSSNVLAAVGDGSARVWEAASGILVASLPKQPGLLPGAALSPDGKPDGFASDSPDKELLHGADLSPDGKWVVTAGQGGHALLWDWRANAIVADWAHPSSVVDARFAPDGRFVATAAEDGQIRFWRQGESQPYLMYRVTAGECQSLALSPDGRWLATIDTSGQVGVFESGTGKLALTNSEPTEYTALRFGVNSGCLVLAGASGAEVWQWPPTGVTQARTTFTKLILDNVRQAGFSPDGRWIYTALAKNEIRLWSTARTTAFGDPVAAFRGHRSQVNATAFSPDGKHLVSASDDGTVRLWAVEASLGRMAREPRTGDRLEAVTGHGDRALFSSTDGVEGKPWQLWSEGTRSLTVIPGLLTNPPCAVFSPDDNLLATAEGAEVRLRDARSGRILDRFGWDSVRGNAELAVRPGPFTPLVVAFSGDGRWLASAGNAGELVRWRMSDRTVAGSLGRGGQTDRERSPAWMALNWDGERIAVVRMNNTIEIWRSLQTAPTVLPAPSEVIGSIAVDPSGEFVAVGLQHGSIWLWRIEPNVLKAELTGHTLQVNCLAWSRDGRFLASGSADRTVRLWSVDRSSSAAATVTADPLGVVGGFTRRPGDDSWIIQAVAWGDGGSLVAASSSGEVRRYAFPELAPGTDLQRLATQERITRRFSREESFRYGLH